MSTTAPRKRPARTRSGAQNPQRRRTDIVIVGGGFAGVGVAVKLLEEGRTDFVLLEKASELGGTWRENTYPGCACDVPSALYSYSWAQNPEWSRIFAEQDEIRRYLVETARSRGVLEHVVASCEVTHARRQDGRWIVETSRGLTLDARVVVAAAGPLHEPRIPAIDGLDTFAGKVMHSAAWDHGYDLEGKCVAVVGTGSSAIQFVPHVARRAKRLTLFQRTAPWVLPKPDREISGVERLLFRRVPGAQRLVRESIYHFTELIQLAQRNPPVMRQLQRIGTAHLRAQVKDPELRAKLTPSFTLGCKRILLSNTYYKALARPNAEVLAQGLARVTPTSVIASDGTEREVDAIIFGTGFHVTDPPVAALVRGEDGHTLAETWGDHGMQALLGTTIAGFPNFFIMLGPNLGNGHGSAFVIIEAQVRYLLDALRAMDRRALASVEPRQDVQDRWNARVQTALEGTVWNAGGCESWYLDEHGRNSTIYPWTTIDLRRRTRKFALEDFVTTPVEVAA